jgi:RNA polymerase sigma factor (sigma-70 family)
MTGNDWLAERFEENRGLLRGVAYRMLGSLGEAEDAVQETWLRLSRSDAAEIQNLRAWLTTVLARVCLDMLRARASRREESLSDDSLHKPASPSAAVLSGALDPEQEAQMADSIGLALLVVLDRLDPAERLAFVLHDTFAMPFDEIAGILGRSPAAARQLASRARRRVQAPALAPDASLIEQRKVVESFLAALRAGDLNSLLAVLDPNLVVHADAGAGAPGARREARGAEYWAKQAIKSARGAIFARLALINGSVGVVVAPRGRLFRVLNFKVAGGKIVEIDVVADPARLRDLDLAVLPAVGGPGA